MEPDLFPISIWGQVLFLACGPSSPTLTPIRHPRERGDPGTRKREKEKKTEEKHNQPDRPGPGFPLARE